MTQLWRAFNDIIPLFLLVLILVGIVAFFLHKKYKIPIASLMVNTFLILSIIGILLVTNPPQIFGGYSERVLNLVPFVGMYNILFNSVDIMVPVRNLGFNILLFVPFGFFFSFRKLRYLRKQALNVALAGFALSFAVEVMQYSFAMGRSADVDDLILNTIGTYLGYVCWKFFRSLFPAQTSMTMVKKDSL